MAPDPVASTEPDGAPVPADERADGALDGVAGGQSDVFSEG